VFAILRQAHYHKTSSLVCAHTPFHFFYRGIVSGRRHSNCLLIYSGALSSIVHICVESELFASIDLACLGHLCSPTPATHAGGPLCHCLLLHAIVERVCARASSPAHVVLGCDRRKIRIKWGGHFLTQPTTPRLHTHKCRLASAFSYELCMFPIFGQVVFYDCIA
jgi:hypothetical protein